MSDFIFLTIIASKRRVMLRKLNIVSVLEAEAIDQRPGEPNNARVVHDGTSEYYVNETFSEICQMLGVEMETRRC